MEFAAGVGGNVDAGLKSTTRSSGSGCNNLAILRRTFLVASANDLNGLERASLVSPLVLSARAVIDDLDGFNGHSEGRLCVIGLSASPFNDALLIVGVTTGPDADAYSGRGLRVVLSAVGIAEFQGSDRLRVDDPGERLRCPVQSI